MERWGYLSIVSFVGGVNCFVLITGWFGISNSLKGFLKIVIETCFWSIISYLFFVIVCEGDFSMKSLIKSIDFRSNWFVISYLMLLLIAPIMEKSLLDITYSRLRNWIILLSIFNIVFVLVLNHLNNNGYNVVQFVFLYYIARFLRLSGNHLWLKKWCKFSFLIYLGLSFALLIGFVVLYEIGKMPASIVWFGYNNPLIILSSISVFIMFAVIKVQSSTINYISKGVFGIFVLHTTKFIIPVRNEYAHQIYLEYGYSGIITMAFLILLICIAITIPGVRITKWISDMASITIKKVLKR